MAMEYDYSKLKGRIVEKFGTVSAFADALGIKVQAISPKLRGRKTITKADIIEWKQLLEIDTDDIGMFFFMPKKFTEMEQKGE